LWIDQVSNVSTNTSTILILRILLSLSSILLLVGFFAPMLTMNKFYFFESSFSVVGGIVSLVEEGQLFIGLVVLLFSVVVPVAKITFLFMLLINAAEQVSLRQQRYLVLMHEYGRWAMLDVLVVAVLIVTVKLGAVASIEVHWGLYVFGLAVVLIMFITHKVTRFFNGKS
jgi:paraquat-inducible protein A